jgi:hypothetical protein
MTTVELQDDLHERFADHPPPHWEKIAAAPQQRAHDTPDALGALWSVLEPLRRREDALRRREAERVGAAAARHALDVVLAQARPRGRAEDGMLLFPDPEGTELDAAGRAVVLSPLLSGLDVAISNLDRGDLLWLAYPAAVAVPDPTGLAALLTPVRVPAADAGRRVVDDPRGCGRRHLRERRDQHVDALVAAGLVVCRREGRHHLVARSTPRGDGMLDLHGTSDAGAWISRPEQAR